jgi:hypothetical protein
MSWGMVVVLMAGVILLKSEERSFANVVFNTFWSIPIWFAASIVYVLGADFPEYMMSRYK